MEQASPLVCMSIAAMAVVRVVLLVVLVILEGDDARLEGLECWSTKGGHSEAEEGNTQHRGRRECGTNFGQRVTESTVRRSVCCRAASCRLFAPLDCSPYNFLG